MIFLGSIALSSFFLVSREAVLTPLFWIAYTVMILMPSVVIFVLVRQMLNAVE